MSVRDSILRHSALTREITGIVLAAAVIVLAFVGVIWMRGMYVLFMALGVYVLNHIVWLGLREWIARRAIQGTYEATAEQRATHASNKSTAAATSPTHRRRTLIDHRDQPRRLLHGWDEADLFKELPSDVALRSRTAANRGYKWRAMTMLAVSVVVTLGSLTLSRWLTSTLPTNFFTGWTSVLLPGAMALMLYITIYGTIFYERAQRRRRLATALLAERHCPCCLYSLAGLDSQADGCTICPECGAAWRFL